MALKPKAKMGVGKHGAPPGRDTKRALPGPGGAAGGQRGSHRSCSQPPHTQTLSNRRAARVELNSTEGKTHKHPGDRGEAEADGAEARSAFETPGQP